jgi:hypothetical protein
LAGYRVRGPTCSDASWLRSKKPILIILAEQRLAMRKRAKRNGRSPRSFRGQFGAQREPATAPESGAVIG